MYRNYHKAIERRSDRAFQAHLKEFEAVRREIEINFGQQDRLVSYALLLTTGSSTLFFLGDPPIAQQQPFTLLIASLLLTAIGWALVETSLTIQLKSRYILENLGPRVQKLVGTDTMPEYRVFAWSESVVTFNARSYFHLLMASGKYIAAFVPSVVFLLVFYFNKSLPFYSWLLSEKVLFISAAIAVGIVVFGPILKLLAAMKKFPQKV